MGRSEAIRISLISTAGVYEATVETPGHTVVAATVIPVGTEGVPPEEGGGPGYTAEVTATLTTQDFDCEPTEKESVSLQFPLVFRWVCEPKAGKAGGGRLITASLHVQWIGGDPKRVVASHQLWTSEFRIEVTDPWLKTDTVRAGTWASGALGLGVSALWLFNLISQKRKGRDGVSQGYNIAAIRRLLLAAFVEGGDLRRLCLDCVPLQPIVVHFGPHQGLDEMVDEVIDYCRTSLVWKELLAAVKETAPEQYGRFEADLRIARPKLIHRKSQ